MVPCVTLYFHFHPSPRICRRDIYIQAALFLCKSGNINNRKSFPVTAAFQGDVSVQVLFGFGSLLTDFRLIRICMNYSCMKKTGRPKEWRLWIASTTNWTSFAEKTWMSDSYLYAYTDASVMFVLDTNGEKQELLKLHLKWMYFNSGPKAWNSSLNPNITYSHNSL